MKRFWLPVIIVLFSVIVLGVFYIQSAFNTDLYPEFNIQKTAGDEAIGEDLLINGNIGMSMLEGMPFQVHANGTHYLRDERFTKRLDSRYVSENFERLRQRYRSFMRGKEDVNAYYFEDDAVLAYVNTVGERFGYHDKGFDIDVLHKSSGKRTHFTVPFPEEELFGFVDIAGIKVLDDRLYLVAHIQRAGESEEEIYSYIFDLTENTLMAANLIDTVEYKETDGYYHTEITLSPGPQEMKVAISEQEILYQEPGHGDEAEGMEETVLHHLDVYDMVTNQKRTIDVPADLGTLVTIDQDHLYFAGFANDKLTFTKLDGKTNRIVKDTEIPLEQSFFHYGDLAYNSLVQDQTFYFATGFYGDGRMPVIGAVGLESMHVKYLGKVEPLDQDALMHASGLPEFHFGISMDRPDVKQK